MEIAKHKIYPLLNYICSYPWNKSLQIVRYCPLKCSPFRCDKSVVPKYSYSLNAKEWKFTLISKWLLFNSNRVGFSSKTAEKTFSWSLAIPSKSHTRVEWPKFQSISRSELLANQKHRKSPNIFWAGATRWQTVCVWMSGEKKVDLMKK